MADNNPTRQGLLKKAGKSENNLKKNEAPRSLPLRGRRRPVSAPNKKSGVSINHPTPVIIPPAPLG